MHVQSAGSQEEAAAASDSEGARVSSGSEQTDTRVSGGQQTARWRAVSATVARRLVASQPKAGERWLVARTTSFGRPAAREFLGSLTHMETWELSTYLYVYMIFFPLFLSLTILKRKKRAKIIMIEEALKIAPA